MIKKKSEERNFSFQIIVCTIISYIYRYREILRKNATIIFIVRSYKNFAYLIGTFRTYQLFISSSFAEETTVFFSNIIDNSARSRSSNEKSPLRHETIGSQRDSPRACARIESCR